MIRPAEFFDRLYHNRFPTHVTEKQWKILDSIIEEHAAQGNVTIHCGNSEKYNTFMKSLRDKQVEDFMDVLNTQGFSVFRAESYLLESLRRKASTICISWRTNFSAVTKK